MGPLVVVLEDDEDLRELVSLALRHEGFDVELFATEHEASDFVAKNAASIAGIVADAVLESGDGLHVCRQLARANDTARIIVLSGDSKLLEAAREQGFVAMLKPSGIDSLVAALRDK